MTETNAVAIKLPTFWAQQPEVWFLQAEAQFHIRKITDPLWGDKVSMLTHIYPHKPWRNIEVTMQNHQADSPLYVWPDV